jgi:hypothetical protein
VTNEQLGSCYKFAIADLATTWSQAETACESNKGLLTSIRNKDERAFLEKFVRNNINKQFWIGGKRRSDQTWVWTGQTINFDTDTDYITPNQMYKIFIYF